MSISVTNTSLIICMQVPGQRPISASNPRPKPVYGRKQFNNAMNNPSSGAPKAVFGSYAQAYGTISSSQLASIQGRKSWLDRARPQYAEAGARPLRGTPNTGVSPYVESVGYYRLGHHYWLRTQGLMLLLLLLLVFMHTPNIVSWGLFLFCCWLFWKKMIGLCKGQCLANQFAGCLWPRLECWHFHGHANAETFQLGLMGKLWRVMCQYWFHLPFPLEPLKGTTEVSDFFFSIT